MRKAPRPALGTLGEEAALDRYRASGYRLVARNWRCPLGEIDLVLARGDTLVVCEVKSRRDEGGSPFGGPHEAVTWRKRQKLQRLAESFLAATGWAPEILRFDVASVIVDGAGTFRVHLFEHAF